jgi:hypothetical protein
MLMWSAGKMMEVTNPPVFLRPLCGQRIGFAVFALVESNRGG